MSSLPSVFEFEDYQNYLHALRLALQSKSRPLTLSAWSKKLGYRSPRALAMVLKGSRLPSRGIITSLSSQLKLTPKETRYLELQVEKHRRSLRKISVEPIEKELNRLRPANSSKRLAMTPEMVSELSNWYHFVIKQLGSLDSFQADPQWIRKKLKYKISETDAARALQRLSKLGILAFNSSLGRLKTVEGVSLFGPVDIPSQEVRKHHRQMLTRAAEALDEQPVAQREIISFTFTMDPQRMAEAKEFLRKQMDEFEETFATESRPEVSEVYQLNFQMFPHTK